MEAVKEVDVFVVVVQTTSLAKATTHARDRVTSLELLTRTTSCLKLINANNLNFPARPHLSLSLQNTPFQSFKMDTLVAQYTQPRFEKENYSEDDQMELYQPTPSLSLKFAMPPVAQVRTSHSFFHLLELSAGCFKAIWNWY
jgi:hypothetical protein